MDDLILFSINLVMNKMIEFEVSFFVFLLILILICKVLIKSVKVNGIDLVGLLVVVLILER